MRDQNRHGAKNARRVACAMVGLVLAATLGAQQKPAASLANGYRIAGTVLNTSTGAPVQRALVSVLVQDDNHTVASAMSDSEGHFAFDGLPATKYPLMASKRGFRTLFYNDHDGYNTAIVTGPDQDPTHLIFWLVPGSVLHGVVSGDGGDPVEGARVMLFTRPRRDAPDQRMQQMDSAMTDDMGAYEFANLADGAYLIAVSAQPWYAMHKVSSAAGGSAAGSDASELDVAYPITYYDSTTDEALATPIEVARGERAEADIHLHAVPALRLAVNAPRRADGRLARPELQQIVFGTQISAESIGFFDAMRRGNAEFDGIAPGHYELMEGDPPHIVDLDASESGQIGPEAGSATVAVTGTLRMPRDTTPPEEAHLFLQPQQGAQSRGNLATTARNGKFRFEAVAPGPWTLMAESEGKVIPVMEVESGGTARAGNVINVKGDHPLTLTVMLAAGTARVSGIALKDGAGFGGAMIVLVPEQGANLVALARRDQSDSDGSFTLPDVVPGTYRVVAIEDGWSLDWTAPGALARYLPRGTTVPVNSRADTVQLSGPVTVQPR